MWWREYFWVICLRWFAGRRGMGVPPMRLGGGVLALLLAATPLAAKVSIGDPLPDLSTLQLEGELPDLTGKVVLLDVWASWCAPCKASFPALAGLQRDFADVGVVIVAVSVDRKERDFRQFLARFKPPFAVARDTTQRFARTFEPPAMPTSYLVDRSGRVRHVHTGFFGDRTVAELSAQIRALVEENS